VEEKEKLLLDASDAELIRQLQHSNLEALGNLFDRYQRLVYRTALGITGDVDAASDLLQDVFLRLHRFVHHVDRDRPLEPWLYRMTVNLAYSWIKRHSRWTYSLEEVAEWLIGGKRNPPQQQVEQNEDWEQLRQSILLLPITHRTVVVMYYVNDLSLQQIADILELPVGTVKSRLHYGRQSLKRNLGRLDGGQTGDVQATAPYELT
jgi:RNA polymerase sigma-70 factor (ECF subfamily)